MTAGTPERAEPLGVQDLFRLDDRVVIVTGASSGLGARFARVLADAGARVVLAARRQQRLDGLVAELNSRGRIATSYPCDVADPSACAALVDATVASFGRVDVLVNNAGIGPARAAAQETPESFRAVVDINLLGVFWMAQACVPHMQPGSSIINVASVLGLVASRFPQASYCATKAGVIGLTRDLAQQWSARKGVRVNALCPGYFITEMNEQHRHQLEPMIRDQTMLGRFGDPSELDGALLFLSSSASTYITGSVLVVDGGLTSL